MTGAEFSGVDIDLLADYIGGALEGTPDESVVAALITDDPAWSAAYESLGGAMELVGAELGRFGPEPMPAELADRLEAMFAAPPLTLVRDGAASVEGAPAVPKKRERKSPARTGRRMRWAAPIAVAAGVIAFVGFGLDYLAGRDSSQSDSAGSNTAGLADSGAAPKVPATEQIYHSGRDYSLDELAGGPARSLVAPDASSETFKKATPDRGRRRRVRPAAAGAADRPAGLPGRDREGERRRTPVGGFGGLRPFRRNSGGDRAFHRAERGMGVGERCGLRHTGRRRRHARQSPGTLNDTLGSARVRSATAGSRGNDGCLA